MDNTAGLQHTRTLWDVSLTLTAGNRGPFRGGKVIVRVSKYRASIMPQC